MSEAVIFGAGNIGRGFIGQLFAESGYGLAFVDIDRPLLDFVNRTGAYDLEAVVNDEVTRHRIGPARGVFGADREAVAATVAGAAIGATAVGARALPAVAPNIAAGIARRAAQPHPVPLNLIICENLKNAAAHVRGLVAPHVPAAAQAYFEEQVGFVDTVIGRMVPPPLPDARAANPGLIRVEPYKELPVDRRCFRGPVPAISAMTAYDNFPLFTARKLYIHNCGHAILAYHGYQRGHEYGYQALADAAVRELLHQGWAESARGIVHEYGADPAWLRAHMADLETRFANRALGDTVFRLGRDPVRKLAANDRLIAPALHALAAGVAPVALAGTIAAALRFDPAADPVAVELQQRLAREGVERVLADVAGLAADHPLTRLVVAAYRAK